MAIWFRVIVTCAVLVSAAFSSAQVKVLINPGDQAEQSRYAIYSNWRAVLERALHKEKLDNPVVTLSMDASSDLGATRSKLQDIFVAPAHVIGSAVRYGYTPVLGSDRPVQAVLVTPRDSAITDLTSAKGKRLGLVLQDSIVTYLVRGEVHAANTTIKRHFGEVYETRYQEALLSCLKIHRCDVVAVERNVFDRWAASGETVRIVLESKTVPGLSVAIRDGSKPGPEALRVALLDVMGTTPDAGRPMVMTAKNFEYVSTLGYFTPRSLPGATVADAARVAQLLKAGALYVDARNDAEFQAGHVSGAKLIPYVEKSSKDPDFNAAEDSFDVAKLPQDRNSVLVFGCNGAECWKSFKGARMAIRQGYKNVHWFRGGFPEWRDSGGKVDLGP